ncbi:pre-toxin TG domain-containing protein [Streptomyces sp. NPDC015171]|uniref:pre-toxin TG domain-containing protein n=1 Tax=Streptomyces sp. NPDC015171 TaxID=3364945 RepID=UPI0037014E9C
MPGRTGEEVRWGLVAEALTSYKHAVMLARGITAAEQAEIDRSPNRTERLRERESRTVPREDMEAAHLIATEVRSLFTEWQSRYSTVPWPGHREFAVRTTMNAASDATRHLADETRRILDGSPPGAGQVRSLRGAWPLVWLQWLYTAFEPLQVIEGELPLPEAAIGRPDEVLHDFAEFVLSAVPVVGEFVLSYEAVIGRQLVGGRKLSKPEQLLAFLGLVIPPVLGALVKQVPRVGGIVLRNFRVNLARRIPGSVAARLDRFTVDMVIALRSFPKESFEKFLGIIRIAGKLTPEQQTSLNFYVSRLNCASRLAQWLRIIERDLGAGFSDVRALKRPPNVVVLPHERAMMEDLSRLSGKRVVSLPELHPQDYDGFVRNLATDPAAKMPQVKGVKYSDTVWGDEFAELYRVERAKSEKNILRAIREAGKGKQASTLVVTRAPNVSLDLPTVFGDRFWGNPQFQWIDKIVILQDGTIKVIARPVRYITMDPRVYVLTRVLVGNPAHLVRTAEEVLRAEAEEKKGRAAER